eukprot:GILK01002170.1.p1 GENE.GILK01002170.1~~GILK01002170.1.p1  ORF type:complete len:121 (+),score=18.23 GILK01002170.1:51-365(+)
MASNNDQEQYRSLLGARILWPPDMPDDMLEDAIHTAHKAIEKHGDLEKDGVQVADMLKKHFDEKWSPHWHVFVGRNFGCFATHEKRRFVYFYIGQIAFMLYKAG